MQVTNKFQVETLAFSVLVKDAFPKLIFLKFQKMFKDYIFHIG